MNSDFNRAFDNFLSERMGAAIADLRQKNEVYASAVHERDMLVQRAKDQQVFDYKQAFDQLNELTAFIRDVESRYYFYTGIAMHKKMNDAAEIFAMPDHLSKDIS